MPLLNDTIVTKVRGVARPLGNEMGPQRLLVDIYNSPEILQEIYIKYRNEQFQVYVIVADQHHLLGVVHPKYDDLLIKNDFKVISPWQITGGHELEGTNTRMHLGMNIKIKLIKHEIESHINEDVLV